MSGTNIQMALLQDALGQVLADPVCAHRWHRLRAVWSGVTDNAAKQRLLNILETLPKGPWRADVMRFTFLHGVTGSAHHASSAAARLLEENSVDPDRLAAFMAYEWLNNIQGASGGGDFVAALASARLPEMSARITRHLVPLLPKKLVPRVPERIQRVAVVMPYLGNLLHTPSVMALDNCAILARLGYQTRVFSCQELVLSDVAHFRGDGNHPLLPPLDLAGWAGMCPPGTGLNISDSRFSMVWRWRGMLDQLAEFDPDIVMLVGLYSHLAAVLHGVRPVVG
ncbi:MAG: hypothetical protein Q8M66_01465, partial [Actinomycetota bacterium]|nr:hypothetical protein [Actinomycetota bacterium]